MSWFMKLEDSPVFQKQVRSIEHSADELRDRCQKLYKGCKKYTEVLGEACNGDTSFAASIEAFGGNIDDPLGVSIGGPVISKFINGLHELATYKEFLRSQVEHVLVDRLSQFLSTDLQDAKESRRRFDKSMHSYDQAREKFSSLRKTTRDEVVAELEEELQNSKSAFERSRFNLVNALMNIEAKKKFEFLESFSAIMDAHLRYFKLGYDLLKQMEPFIHQVLNYAQQSKEQSNIEQDRLAKRIQEFRTQSELAHNEASNIAPSSNVIGMKNICSSSYRSTEAIMQLTSKGEVQTLKQGYLLKRSSSLRTEWQRRFFILDSQGNLYYYRNRSAKSGDFPSSHSSFSSEHNNRVFGRFRNRHQRTSSTGEESLGCRTIDLRTSTIKIDAEDTDLRLCFRIISPLKSYTLQAENDADRIDWMNKITGVITSLLTSHLQQMDCGITDNSKKYDPSCASISTHVNIHGSVSDAVAINLANSVPRILREVPGNNQCAECSAHEPDWASLNLGILICIECSGLHRNLGVHISKVRSVTLDVKVWDQVVLDLFQALGNEYCNSVWEELLPVHDNLRNESEVESHPVLKPNPEDAIQQKEKYIQAKYVRKLLVNKEATEVTGRSLPVLWEAVKTNNLREVYRVTAASDSNIVNSVYDDVISCEGCSEQNFHDPESNGLDPATCERIISSSDPGNCLQGCSLLHLACRGENLVMIELLLQLGADMNRRDFHGRTPLLHCILKGRNELAKFLLRRGARASIKDGGGFTALERAMEMGAITDEALFILLTENE